MYLVLLAPGKQYLMTVWKHRLPRLGTQGILPAGIEKSLPLPGFLASVWRWDVSIKHLCDYAYIKVLSTWLRSICFNFHQDKHREKKLQSERDCSYLSLYSSRKISSALQVDLFVLPVTGEGGFDCFKQKKGANQLQTPKSCTEGTELLATGRVNEGSDAQHGASIAMRET